MATSKSNTESTKSTEDSEAPVPTGKPDDDDPTVKKGELTGKVRGPDVDSSYHVEEFTDPKTGKPVEWKPIVHDVVTGPDGQTEPGDAAFVKPSEGKSS
jgi:hypothetical protein